MIPIDWLLHLIAVIHHIMATYELHTVCHYSRVHFIAPKPGHKWVTVAHIRCRIMAPSNWYTGP